MNAGMADCQKMSVKPRAYTSWPQIREMLLLRTHWLVSTEASPHHHRKRNNLILKRLANDETAVELKPLSPLRTEERLAYAIARMSPVLPPRFPVANTRPCEPQVRNVTDASLSH
jgi:hypothetical protein